MSNIITQEYNLSFLPGAIPVEVNVSQYDKTNRKIKFYIDFAPSSGAVFYVRGTKPDNKGFEYQSICTYNSSDQTITFPLQEQMTVVPGRVRCELKYVDGTTGNIASANFVLRVKPSALSDGVDTSETIIPDATRAAREAQAAAESAATRAETATQAVRVTATRNSEGVLVTTQDLSGSSSAQLYDGQAGSKGDKGDTGSPGPGITSVVQNSDYSLTITYGDGSTVTTDPIRGATGSRGPQGPKGDTGDAGPGITSIVNNSDNSITITYGDGSTVTTAPIVGSKGDKGDKGDPGDDYVLTNADKVEIRDAVYALLTAANTLSF